MPYYIFFNKIAPKDFGHLDIQTSGRIDLDEMDDALCRGIFPNDEILRSVRQASFTLYHKLDTITGIACITMYGNSWEITHVCGAERDKGVGSRLIAKLKDIAATYPSVTLYGLALYEGSKALYLKNGFVDNQFHVGRLRKASRKRRTVKIRKLKTKRKKRKE